MELKCGPTHALTDAVAAYGALGNPESMEGVRLLLHRKGLTPVGPGPSAKAGSLKKGTTVRLSLCRRWRAVLLDAAGMGRRRREGLEASRIVDQSRLERRRRLPCRPVRSTALLSMPLLRFSWLGPATWAASRNYADAGINEGTDGEAPSVTTVEAQVILARALVLLSDHASARQLLCEARARVAQLLVVGIWPKRQPKPNTSSPLPLPPRRSLDPLSPAEIRVLRYLPTYMTFEEISR